ncbi:MAG: hypothetical protein GX424_11230 [Clostridiales bacterium]|nr:hypothetical protein [Clostridiales bacterium]
MKKLIPFLAAALAAAAVLSFSGCAARTPVSADNFKKQAESQGFKVTEDSSSGSDAQKVLTAAKSSTGTQIVFYSFASESAAEDAYLSMKDNLSATGVSGKTLDTATFSKYTLVNGELSHTLARMDTTIVYGKTTVAHKSEVDQFFSAIKY